MKKDHWRIHRISLVQSCSVMYFPNCLHLIFFYVSSFLRLFGRLYDVAFEYDARLRQHFYVAGFLRGVAHYFR